MKRALVIANGEKKEDQNFFQQLMADIDTVVCADGGAELAYKLGLKPDKIYGDLDSLDSGLQEEFQKMGVSFVTFPAEKDKTDTHLVLDYLIEEGYKEIIIVGGLGGRVDHMLGNLFLLNYGFSKGIKIKLVSPSTTVEVIERGIQITNQKGAIFSLIPIDSIVEGVSLDGFKYPLKNCDVYRESTLGISNIIVSDNAQVKIIKGRAFIFITTEN